MKDIIRKMVEGFGPSGFEDRIRKIIEAEISGLVDSMDVDALGNLIAFKKGTARKNRKKIMVAAHMDEIGAMVSFIDEKGFVRITNLGGVHAAYELGGRVEFENGTIGVINMETMKEPGKMPGMNHLYVDVGATSRDDCPVAVGDVMNFLQPMIEMGPCLASKAMDDRVGCAIMIQALKELKRTPHDLYFAFTTQEEVGLRGATTGAFGIEPDVGIAIDVTRTGDTPEPGSKMAVSLGDGAAIKIKDGGMLTTPWVKDWMIETAEANKINYQLEVLLGGTTDACAIQKTRSGVAAGCISVPTRYVHSPSETVNYQDILDSVALLVAMLKKPRLH